MSQTPRDAVIVGGNRIPFARSNTAYSKASNQDMLTAALDGLVARFGLAGQRLGEVAGGAVLKHARDFNLVRESVLGSALSPETPAFDIQKACDTSLEATIAVANKIRLGQIDSGIACGVDTTSDAPVALNEDLRHVLMEANRAKGPMDYVKLLGSLRPDQIVLVNLCGRGDKDMLHVAKARGVVIDTNVILTKDEGYATMDGANQGGN